MARFPRTFALLGLLTSPMWMSGVVRTLTGCSLNLALGVTCLGVGLIVWRLRLYRALGSLRDELGAWALAIFLFASLFALLYNHDFYGTLAFTGIPDAAHHVQNRRAFATSNPHIYAGAVAQYALTTWLKRALRCNEFWAMTITFYAIVAALCVVIAGAIASTLEGLSLPQRALVGLGVVVCGAPLAVFGVIPLLHYYQCEGFYPQLFALVPLMMLWIVEATTAHRLLRIAFVLMLVVAYRYSYALHVPEVLAALSLVFALDVLQKKNDKITRAAHAGLAIVLGVAALYATRAIIAIFHLKGPFIPYELREMLAGQWMLVATLAACFVLPPSRRLLDEARATAWLRFPLLLITINTIAMTVIQVPPREEDYYYYKLHFHSLLLALAAATVILGAALGQLMRSSRSVERQVAFVLLLVTASFGSGLLFRAGFAPWEGTYVLRAFHRAPYPVLKPLADLDAWARIQRILREEHKEFGGYLTSFYPTMTFMNSSFNFVNGEISFYWGSTLPDVSEGHCVFWEFCADEKDCLEAGFPQRWRIDEYMADKERQCIAYHPHWNPAGKRDLCWRCY